MPDETPQTSQKKTGQYRDRPQHFIQPNDAELKARHKRSIAIAIGLAAFMAFVFITMITRTP